MDIYYSRAYTRVMHDFDTTRKPTWVAESLVADPIPGVRMLPPIPVSEHNLKLTHSPDYVNAVIDGKNRLLAESNGFMWDPEFFAAVAASNGGIVEAAFNAYVFRKHSGSLSCGLHHARRDSGMGFCTFNGLALAVRGLEQIGARRVLILDLDAHCGGGTYSLVGGLPNVTHLDVSVNDFDGYQPSGQSSLDIVTSPDSYFYHLKRRLEVLDDEQFDVMLYNAGMDVHEDSIGGLSGMNMAMMATREHMVYEWAQQHSLPVAFVLAGGYTSERLSQERLVQAHRLTIAEAVKGLQTKHLQAT